MAKEDSERQLLPPYVSYKTLQGFIERLHETTVPERIDSSLLQSYSGSAGRQIMGALRYLRLIEETGRVTDKFLELVDALGMADWKKKLADVIKEAYAPVIGHLSLETATHGQLVEKFKMVGAEGEVLEKCVSFYVTALRNTDEPLSPHIANRPRARAQRPNRKNNRKQEAVSTTESENANAAQAGTVRFAFPIPDKSPATILVPAELATDDWQMIDSMVRAYISRREKK